MKHLKYISIFLSLGLRHHSVAVLIDDFTSSESGFNDIPVSNNATDLYKSGITPVRSYTIGVGFNKETDNLFYNDGSAASIYYDLAPTWSMKATPIIQVNFPSDIIENVKNKLYNSVILTDKTGRYINIDKQQLTSDHQLFNFTDQFDKMTYPGRGDFDYHNIKQVKISLNVTGSRGDNYNPLNFEIESIEAVPEPFSLITLGTGIAAFIKKDKNLILFKPIKQNISSSI